MKYLSALLLLTAAVEANVVGMDKKQGTYTIDKYGAPK